MTTYHLELTVRAPLHIGSGGPPLRRNIDFANYGRSIYVFDLDAVFDYILPDTSDIQRLQEITRSANLASFLKETDFRAHPDLAEYQLVGFANVNEVRPQLKDGMGRVYVPGSTIKGAIRTALGTAIAAERQVRIIGAGLGSRREWAARDLEQSLFGRAPEPRLAPNYDLMRTIQVSDSQLIAPDALELHSVIVWPAGERGIPIDVEAVRTGTTFHARLKLDEYLLGPQAQKLDFGSNVQMVRNWIAICQSHGVQQLQQEARFFQGRSPDVEHFYAQLLAEAETREPFTFFTQLGWGTGWNSKTFSRIIQADSTLLARIVERYRLTRGVYQPGAPFPRTRHVITDDELPIAPLGWVKVRVVA